MLRKSSNPVMKQEENDQGRSGLLPSSDVTKDLKNSKILEVNALKRTNESVPGIIYERINRHRIKLLLVFIISFIVCSNSWSSCDARLTCLDESGKAVDWFIVYKIPRLETHPRLNSGYSYAFISGPQITSKWRAFPFHSSKNSASWKLSTRLISDSNSILGQTLDQVYKNPLKYSYIFYNDQVPGKTSSSSLAHAKGILATDASSGFWLTHSVPHFAEEPKRSGGSTRYSYPDNAKYFGQTALCISFTARSQIDNILSQLLVMGPNIYSLNFTSEVSSLTNKTNDIQKKRWSKTSDRTQAIQTLKGNTFTSFVRSRKSELKELYLEVVAPGLGSDLFVETWRNGQGDPLHSNCSYKYKVNNIEAVQLTFEDASKTSVWSYTEDHSKWAVSQESNRPASCFGDINRMASQYKRGGGAVCLLDPNVWQVMKDSIAKLEGCPVKRNRVTLSRP